MANLLIQLVKGTSGNEYVTKIEMERNGKKFLLSCSLEEVMNKDFYLEKYGEFNPTEVIFVRN